LYKPLNIQIRHTLKLSAGAGNHFHSGELLGRHTGE
jgi:hypothetical protein